MALKGFGHIGRRWTPPNPVGRPALPPPDSLDLFFEAQRARIAGRQFKARKPKRAPDEPPHTEWILTIKGHSPCQIALDGEPVKAKLRQQEPE